MGGWGKVRAPTMVRLARAMETRPKATGKAYAAIISRSRPASSLSEGDALAVAEWADASGMGCVPLKDFEVAAVSNAAIADELFNGDKTNARKGARLLVEAGVVDRARQGRRGHASVYVTYPTHADFEEGSYVPPKSEESGYACVPPNNVDNSIEDGNRGYGDMEYGVHDHGIGGTEVPDDLGFRKHLQNTSEITTERARAAAADGPAPRAPEGPKCPRCGSLMDPFPGNPKMAECRRCGTAMRVAR